MVPLEKLLLPRRLRRPFPRPQARPPPTVAATTPSLMRTDSRSFGIVVAVAATGEANVAATVVAIVVSMATGVRSVGESAVDIVASVVGSAANMASGVGSVVNMASGVGSAVNMVSVVVGEATGAAGEVTAAVRKSYS